MKILICNLLLLFYCYSALFGQNKKSIDEILSNQYEFKMISSGNHMPDFNPSDGFLPEIVVLLHHGISPDEIQKYFKWDNRTIASKIGILKNANFIKTGDDGKTYPDVFVCSINDGSGITRQLNPLIKQITDSIQKNLFAIEQEVKMIEALRTFKFEDVSFLILSDVLLDNWQINNVENEFLKSPRTPRHGKNYYASYQEKPKNTDRESFGIYGNQMENAGTFTICRYGNMRYSKEILDLDRAIKKEYAFSKTVSQVPCPLIGNNDNDKLQKIADTFKPALIKILDKNKEIVRKNYQASIYSKEISFEEYFIWMYHFIYTGVTDELISRKEIKLPEENVAFYILKND
jgi:hypothetical protein